MPLNEQAALWATMNGDDANNVTRDSGEFQSLARDTFQHGETPSSSGAQTEPCEPSPIRKGALNACFVTWLQGYPMECAIWWLTKARQPFSSRAKRGA